MENRVTSMTVVVDGVEYDVVPGETCDEGCAFRRACERGFNAPAPVFNGHALCADIDVIFKKRRSR